MTSTPDITGEIEAQENKAMTHPDPLRAVREALETCDHDDNCSIWEESWNTECDCVKARALQALEHLTALESLVGGGWQPIETAPKDGRKFLGYTLERAPYGQPVWRVEECYWDGICPDDPVGRFASRSGALLDHWQPLPLPPGAVPVTPAQLSEEEMVGVMEIGEATLLDIATSLEKWLFPIIRLHEEENGRFSWSHYEALTVIKEAIRPYLTIANVTKKEGV